MSHLNFANSVAAYFTEFTSAPEPITMAALTAAFAAHNIEEIYFFRLLASSNMPVKVSRPVFVLATLILTAAFAAIALDAQYNKGPWIGVAFLAVCMIGLNALGHIGRSIFTRAYVPGTATAIAVVAPACAIVLDQMIQANRIPLETVVVALIAGLVAMIPVIAAALLVSAFLIFIARMITPNG